MHSRVYILKRHRKIKWVSLRFIDRVLNVLRQIKINSPFHHFSQLPFFVKVAKPPRPKTAALRDSTFILTQSIKLSNYPLVNFRGLVLACIEGKFRNQILVGERILFEKEIVNEKIGIWTKLSIKKYQT